jgi:hypothetical protein
MRTRPARAGQHSQERLQKIKSWGLGFVFGGTGLK